MFDFFNQEKCVSDAEYFLFYNIKRFIMRDFFGVKMLVWPTSYKICHLHKGFSIDDYCLNILFRWEYT